MTARERQKVKRSLQREVEQNLGLRLNPLFWRTVASDDCFVDGLTRILRAARRLKRPPGPTPADSQTKHRAGGSRGPYKGTLERWLRTFAFIVEHEIPTLSLLLGDCNPARRISWPDTLARWNRHHPPSEHVFLINTLETRWRRAREPQNECLRAAYVEYRRREWLARLLAWLDLPLPYPDDPRASAELRTLAYTPAIP